MAHIGERKQELGEIAHIEGRAKQELGEMGHLGGEG